MILLFVVYVCVVLDRKLPERREVELPPDGIPKFNIAFVDVPMLVTVA